MFCTMMPARRMQVTATDLLDMGHSLRKYRQNDMAGSIALRRVSLEVAAGECVALAGRNGSGKTTLLRIAAQLGAAFGRKADSSPDAGAIRTADTGTGFVAHATMVYDEFTAEENLIAVRAAART